MKIGQTAVLCGALLLCGAVVQAAIAQEEVHNRGYKPPPPTGHIVVQVEKAFNEKPLENAAVIFRAVKNGKDDGNLEIKSNSQGKAVMDLLEIGSHVKVQVIVPGYATAAREFELGADDVDIVIRMQRPREQISAYEDNTGMASTVQPGLQEPEHLVRQTGPKPTTAVVSGTLKDEHGARVPGGVVKLHPAAGRAPDLTTASDAEGNYKFERVPPGAYDLLVNAPGYAVHTRHNLVLNAGETEIYQEKLLAPAIMESSPRAPLAPVSAGTPQ